MSNAPKKRGRPTGSCLNDSEALNAMADMMLINPKLKPTNVIRKILADSGPTLIHRLRRKWKAQREDLIAKAAARKRREQEGQIRRVQEMSISMIDRSIYGRLGSVYGDAVSRAIGTLNDPHLQFLKEHQRSTKLSQEMARIAETLQGSLDLATMSGIRDAINSPALKAIRDMDKTQRQIREALGLSLIDRF